MLSVKNKEDRSTLLDKVSRRWSKIHSTSPRAKLYRDQSALNRRSKQFLNSTEEKIVRNDRSSYKRKPLDQSPLPQKPRCLIKALKKSNSNLLSMLKFSRSQRIAKKISKPIQKWFTIDQFHFNKNLIIPNTSLSLHQSTFPREI